MINEKSRQIFFLENLLNKLKNDELSRKEQIEISEFYMKYMYEESNSDSIEQDRYNKYLFLGWYIYEILNNPK